MRTLYAVYWERNTHGARLSHAHVCLFPIRDDDDARQRTTVNAWTNGRDRRETRRLVGRLVGAFVRRLGRA